MAYSLKAFFVHIFAQNIGMDIPYCIISYCLGVSGIAASHFVDKFL